MAKCSRCKKNLKAFEWALAFDKDATIQKICIACLQVAVGSIEEKVSWPVPLPEDPVARAQAEAAALRQALQDLVDLKGQKDKNPGIHYREETDACWRSARGALKVEAGKAMLEELADRRKLQEDLNRRVMPGSVDSADAMLQIMRERDQHKLKALAIKYDPTPAEELKNKVRMSFVNFVIRDPFPEHTAYQREEMETTLLERLFLRASRLQAEPPPEISIHAAWQKGFNFARDLALKAIQ